MGRTFLSKDMSGVAKLREFVKSNLKDIKEEFDDHLQTINDNTSEIQATYEYAFRLEEKLKKLDRRLDRIESLTSGSAEFESVEDDSGIELNDYEKKIFLILYTASESRPVNYGQIAQYLGEDELLIRGHVTNMLEKGLPVQKRYDDGCVYLFLDRKFRETQTKHNVLGISQKTVKEFVG